MVVGNELGLLDNETQRGSEKSKIPETLTRKDGEEIKEELLKSLRRSTDSDIRGLADEVAAATPRINSGGDLYIGIWKLNRAKAELVRRTPGAAEGPVFYADVSKRSGYWIVGEVTVGRIIRR